MGLMILLCLITATAGLPVQNETAESKVYICPQSPEPTYTKVLPRSRFGKDIAGFHYVFVNANGSIANTRGPKGTQVEIAGSPLASTKAIMVAADIVAKMSKYMPSSIFTTLAASARVGVFTAAEKLIIFSEYASLANGNCGKNCTGSCKHTCTFDGRKYENIAGVGGTRAVVLDDNILCTSHDPYRHTQNILSHEFTHTIHDHALPADIKHQITLAYNTAKSHSTWVLSSYAMANDHEYLAEGGSVYFFINRDKGTSGGMVSCGTSLCSSEQAAREHMRNADPGLYNVLTYIFTNNRPNLVSGLTICPSSTVVG